MDSSFIPAAPPPPGATLDFGRKPWSSVTFGIMSVTIAVVVIAVAVRMFTKLYVIQKFHHEDCKLPIWSNRTKLTGLDMLVFAAVSLHLLPCTLSLPLTAHR